MKHTSVLFGVTVAALAIGGCGLGQASALRMGPGEMLRVRGQIPVAPGAPDLGQQPPIAQDPDVAGKPVPLSLVYTTDMHSRIEPFADDYYHKTYAGKGGLARVATMVKQLRAQNANTAVLDSGDFLVGTPYFNYFRGKVETEAMNLIGFDAITIGNHEFDGGVVQLREAMSGYKGRRVATNVTFDNEIAQRYAVFKAGKVRVGIFGLLTEVNGLVTPPNFAGAHYHDPIATAKAVVAKLEKEADVIVAISHVGTVPPWSDQEEDRPDTHEDGDEKALVSDEKIAEAVPGIDVILSGHTHLLIKKPKAITRNGKRCLIVSSGFGGGYIGKFDVTIQDGTITQYENYLLPIAKTVAADPGVEGVIAPYKAKLDPIVKETIGVASGDFKRYNSRDLESGLNNLIADATLAAARKHNPQVDFALVSSGTPRNNISAGAITVEKVFFALPFDNKVVNVTVTGDVAREMLRIQRRPSENKRHAISANAAYTLIPSPNGKQDIRDITIDGKAFDKSRTYTIAVTDYMSDGGAGFAMLPGQQRQDTGIIQRDALLTHIKAAGTLVPQTGRIKIKSR